jgi:hypothetical protein
MLTGYDDVETMRQGFRAGVTFFLGKPFTRERATGLFSAMRGAILREKRQHARLPYRTAVECSVGDPPERRFTAESINVGEGGMLIEPSGGVEKGQVLRLEFRMPNRKKPLSSRKSRPSGITSSDELSSSRGVCRERNHERSVTDRRP